MKGVINTFSDELKTANLPGVIIKTAAYFTSYIELICGMMLIIVLFTNYALYLLAVDLIFVVVAFSIIKPMWDMQLVFPRLVLLSILLYLPTEWTQVSANRFLILLV